MAIDLDYIQLGRIAMVSAMVINVTESLFQAIYEAITQATDPAQTCELVIWKAFVKLHMMGCIAEAIICYFILIFTQSCLKQSYHDCVGYSSRTDI